MPLYASSTYEMDGDEIRYIRHGNTPNQEAVSSTLASLEEAETATVTPSGTAAVSMALAALHDTDDHLIVQDHVYGGTRKLLEELSRRFGLRVTFVRGDRPDSWRESLQKKTRSILFESITNPLMEIAPLDEVVGFAREHGLISIIDNSYASPVNFRPTEIGFDLVLHSASKYLNGHSDLVAGVIAGRATLLTRIRRLMDLSGVCLDPHVCHQLARGLKTLPLRVAAQNQTALALANALLEHPGIESVRYPGLPGDPFHSRAKRWLSGCGAIVTFTPRGGLPRAERLLSRLRLPRLAPSFGGVESLVCRPANTSFAGYAPAIREALGVTDAMIRVSVGIEDADDLIEDFEEALSE
jgi:cystathionine beta-lyase/cystathionine gamma-synthase